MRALQAILFLWTLSSDATTAVIHDIRTMTQNSGVVVQAKIVSQKVTEDARGRIITLSTLRVEDGMKGARTGQELTLYQVGGELNGRVMRLQGASVYRPGEEIMLFAVPHRDQVVSYGLGLGKFNIIQDKVVEDIHDLEVVDRKDGRQFYRAPTPRRYNSLKAFKDEIRKAL